MISHLFCFIIDMFCTMIVLIALCHWSHKSTLSKTSSSLAIISTVIFISQNQSACIKILFNKYFYYIFIKPCKLQIQFSINEIRINSEFIQENTKCTKTKLNERQISSTNHHNSHGTYCICFVLFFFHFAQFFQLWRKKLKFIPMSRCYALSHITVHERKMWQKRYFNLILSRLSSKHLAELNKERWKSDERIQIKRQISLNFLQF